MTLEPRIMLCASPEDLQLIASFALSMDDLRSFSWLTLCSDAQLVRQELQDNPLYQEVWVLSSSEVEGINLAAALKSDTPDRLVCLVALRDVFRRSSRLVSRSVASFARGRERRERRAPFFRRGGAQ